MLYPYRLDQVRKNDNIVISKKDLDKEATEKFEGQVEGLLKKSRITFEFHAEVGFIRDRVFDHARRANVVMLVISERMATAESFPELMKELTIPILIMPSKKE